MGGGGEGVEREERGGDRRQDARPLARPSLRAGAPVSAAPWDAEIWGRSPQGAEGPGAAAPRYARVWGRSPQGAGGPGGSAPWE